jgi:hypothetical protein
MGYSQVWESNNRTLTGCPSDPDEEGKRFFKYSYQSQYGLDAGLDSTVVSAGLPSSSSWGDGNVRDHLQDILDLPSPTGICIWDFTIDGSEWRKSSTWEMVKQIRDLDPVTPVITGNKAAQLRSLSVASISHNQIKVTVVQAGRYSLSLYNASGRIDRIFSSKCFSKGIHALPLINSDRANGVYIVRITGEGQSVSQKIIISK